MAQISTAISDFVLSAVSFYGASFLARSYVHAAIGFLLIAFAAGSGAIRFLDIVSSKKMITELHDKASWFAAILGIPLIATSFCVKYGVKNYLNIHLISSTFGIILSSLFPKLKDVCTQCVSTLAMFHIMILSFQVKNIVAIAAVILYVIAVVVFGTSGNMMGYRNVDIFHYILVLANYTFIKALMKY